MLDRQNDPVISQINVERYQGHDTRIPLFAALEEQLNRPVVSFFTSFQQPVQIEDSDADMLEGLLQKADLSNGLALMISSPGGSGLSAERIIKVCRSYSGTGEYWAIVPGKAKSAATMLCFGASRILMGVNSELGPVDPQLTIEEDGRTKWFSVYNVVWSYRDLFARAVAETGRLEPYLQQLSNYDEREIKEYEAHLALSEDISVRALRSGMLQGKSEDRIRDTIERFLNPKETKTHGRPIFRDEAESCGLTVQEVKPSDALWVLIYELYLRTYQYVNTFAVKCIETRTHSFHVPMRS